MLIAGEVDCHLCNSIQLSRKLRFARAAVGSAPGFRHLPDNF